MLHLTMLLFAVQGPVTADTSALVRALGVAARSAVDSAKKHQLGSAYADADVSISLESIRQAAGAANMGLGSLAGVVQAFGAKGIRDSTTACTASTRCPSTPNVIQVSMSELAGSTDSISGHVSVYYTYTRNSGLAATGFVMYRVVMLRRGEGYALGSVRLLQRS